MTGLMAAGLAAFLAMIALEYAGEKLNQGHLRRHGADVPAVFQGLVDPAQMERARDYSLAKTRWGIRETLANQAVLIALLFGNGLNLYNQWIAGLGLPFILQGMVFFTGLFLAKTLFDLPWDGHRTFVLETRFGFNTTSAGLWLADAAKSLLISLALISLLCGAAFWLVQAFPAAWWMMVWFFFLFFSVLIMYLSPYVLEPLFNKFTPIDDPALVEPIRSLMARLGIRVSRVFKKDASKRSRHSNAYFTGIGPVKRIVLYDTLLASMTPEEILAVLAHEAGHWRKRHLLQRLAVSELGSLVTLLAAFYLLSGQALTQGFNLAADTFSAKLVVFGFLVSLASFPLTPLSSAWSRWHEREADAFAAQAQGTGEHLARALVKLSRDNLANLHPHPWYAAWYYAHPPVVQRVEALQRMTRNHSEEAFGHE